MILTAKQIEEFKEAAKPLVKFLNDNCHPHVTAIVTSTRAKLEEGLCVVKLEEFLRD